MHLSIPLSPARQAVGTAAANVTFTANVDGTDNWKAEGETTTITYTFSFTFSS